MQSIWLSLLVFVFAGLLTSAALNALQSLHTSRIGHSVVTFFFRMRVAHPTLIGLITTPIVEEVLFRGIMTPLSDPLISIILFACVHRGMWLRSAAFLFACAMETLMATGGTLFVCVAAHLAVNLTTFVFVQRIPLLEMPDGSRAIVL